MEVDDLLEGLSKHVDALDHNLKWTTSLGFLAAVLVLQGSPKVTLLGLDLPRQHAFLILELVFTGQCLLLSAHMRALKELMGQFAPQDVPLALSRLSSNPSFLNPFSFWRRRDGSLYTGGLNALSYMTLIYCLCVGVTWLLLPTVFPDRPLSEWWQWPPWPSSAEEWRAYLLSSFRLAPYGGTFMALMIAGLMTREGILAILPSLSVRLGVENEALRRQFDTYHALLKKRAERDGRILLSVLVIVSIVYVVRHWP